MEPDSLPAHSAAVGQHGSAAAMSSCCPREPFNQWREHLTPSETEARVSVLAWLLCYQKIAPAAINDVGHRLTVNQTAILRKLMERKQELVAADCLKAWGLLQSE